MISEKKDRLLGSSGSSKTEMRGKKILTAWVWKTFRAARKAVTKKHVLKKRKEKRGIELKGLTL